MLEKLKIFIPHNLKVIWGLLKVKAEDAYFKKIIVCAFYSPPYSKKNLKLTDHLITILQMLKTKYPGSPMILGADKNSMNIKPLINCGLKLRNIVDLPTRQGKILDILLTNIPQFYNSPVIVPPVPCDNPTSGKPSDHFVPVSYPHTDRSKPPVRRYKTVVSRPLPETSVNQFGGWIINETFTNVKDDVSPCEQAQMLQKLLMSKLDEFCPVQTFKLISQDKPFHEL